MIALNVTSQVRLAKRVVRTMAERRQGRILLRRAGCRGWASRAGVRRRPRVSSRARRLPLVGDHEAPEVVGEAPLEAPHRLVPGLPCAILVS